MLSHIVHIVFLQHDTPQVHAEKQTHTNLWIVEIFYVEHSVVCSFDRSFTRSKRFSFLLSLSCLFLFYSVHPLLPLSSGSIQFNLQLSISHSAKFINKIYIYIHIENSACHRKTHATEQPVSEFYFII